MARFKLRRAPLRLATGAFILSSGLDKWKGDEETAATILSLMAKGVLSVGAWNTDDCRKTFEEYSARGVEFLQEPADRPYGVEAMFRDPWGNWYSLNETNFDAFDSEAMGQAFEAGDAD